MTIVTMIEIVLHLEQLRHMISIAACEDYTASILHRDIDGLPTDAGTPGLIYMLP